MEKSSFFNSVNGDRKYKASDFAEFFNSLVTNGIFPNLNTNLQVVANSNNMTVTVKPGKAWINGYVYINTDNLILNVDVADGVLNRIDRVVIKLDFLNREIKTSIKKGTFASNPVAPELQRDADAYELGVADIYISKGAISITQSNITDLRMNTNLCGWVNSLIQADTTAIFNQYMDWYNSKKNDYEGWYSSTTNQYQTDMSNMESQFQNDFNTWFDTVKNTLGSDVAGNLLNQINNLAGEGRTTETVKGNADAIADLKDIIDKHSIDTTKHITSIEISNWNNKIDSSKIGVANGVAGLGADGKIPSSQLSVLSNALYDYFTVAEGSSMSTGKVCNFYRDGKIKPLELNIKGITNYAKSSYSTSYMSYYPKILKITDILAVVIYFSNSNLYVQSMVVKNDLTVSASTTYIDYSSYQSYKFGAELIDNNHVLISYSLSSKMYLRIITLSDYVSNGYTYKSSGFETPVLVDSSAYGDSYLIKWDDGTFLLNYNNVFKKVTVSGTSITISNYTITGTISYGYTNALEKINSTEIAWLHDTTSNFCI